VPLIGLSGVLSFLMPEAARSATDVVAARPAIVAATVWGIRSPRIVFPL
jgi:hypothetical protein